MKRALWIVTAGLVLATAASQAQTGQPPAGQTQPGMSASNMEILRQKMKADKKLVVATNMGLTEAEAKAFWPVYDAYQTELTALNGRTSEAHRRLRSRRTTPVRSPTTTAKSLLTEMMAIDQAEVAMRQSFLPKIQAVLPAAKVARYLQIENKIRALIKYELAAAIPLVQ